MCKLPQVASAPSSSVPPSHRLPDLVPGKRRRGYEGVVPSALTVSLGPGYTTGRLSQSIAESKAGTPTATKLPEEAVHRRTIASEVGDLHQQTSEEFILGSNAEQTSPEYRVQYEKGTRPSVQVSSNGKLTAVTRRGVESGIVVSAIYFQLKLCAHSSPTSFPPCSDQGVVARPTPFRHVVLCYQLSVETRRTTFCRRRPVGWIAQTPLATCQAPKRFYRLRY